MGLTVGSGNGNSHEEGFQNLSMQNLIYMPLTLTLPVLLRTPPNGWTRMFH